MHSPERAERDMALSVRGDFSLDATSPLFPDPVSGPLAQAPTPRSRPALPRQPPRVRADMLEPYSLSSQ